MENVGVAVWSVIRETLSAFSVEDWPNIFLKPLNKNSYGVLNIRKIPFLCSHSYPHVTNNAGMHWSCIGACCIILQLCAQFVQIAGYLQKSCLTQIALARLGYLCIDLHWIKTLSYKSHILLFTILSTCTTLWVVIMAVASEQQPMLLTSVLLMWPVKEVKTAVSPPPH